MMRAEVEIRSLQSHAEADACAHIMSSSEPWITLGRDYGRSLSVIQDASREVYVAVMGEKVVGFAVLCLVGAFTGYIQTIAIAADQRGQGLGSLLLAIAEDRIFRESPNVFLCVSSFNRDARRLYERQGYEYVGELTDYLVRGHSELLFRKTRGSWREFLLANTSR
jgi:[ribosomal protein S18]-alanine N-acetyltransferase